MARIGKDSEEVKRIAEAYRLLREEKIVVSPFYKEVFFRRYAPNGSARIKPEELIGHIVCGRQINYSLAVQTRSIVLQAAEILKRGNESEGAARKE